MRIICTLALILPLAACQSQDKAERFGVSESREDLARATIERFKSVDPGLSSFFDSAKGYAVFPSVGKAAWVIGGARGKGVLFENGTPVGRCELTQVSLGAQWGGQTFSEAIFFASDEALADFKKSKLELSAQISAVALTAGASANVDYESGVAIFTLPRGGLMFDVSVGGQKFRYYPD